MKVFGCHAKLRQTVSLDINLFLRESREPSIWLRTQLPGAGRQMGRLMEFMRMSLGMVRVIPFSSLPFRPATSPFTAHLQKCCFSKQARECTCVGKTVLVHLSITMASFKKAIALTGISITVIAKGITCKEH